MFGEISENLLIPRRKIVVSDGARRSLPDLPAEAARGSEGPRQPGSADPAQPCSPPAGAHLLCPDASALRAWLCGTGKQWVSSVQPGSPHQKRPSLLPAPLWSMWLEVAFKDY